MQKLNLPKMNEEKIKRFLEIARAVKEFSKVEFVILYGSLAQRKANKLSDIDICIYFNGSKGEAYDFALKLSYDSKIDVQIFQQLPLYVRVEVLKGKILYVKNRRFLYDVAYSTIQEFEDFKKYYYEYINAV